MSASPGSFSVDDFVALPDDGERFELVAGALRRMSPSGQRHSALGVALSASLYGHVRKSGLGLVTGADGGFVLEREPDTVLVPDVAFAHRDRLPEGRPTPRVFEGAPDLAVEIVSPSDRFQAVHDKVVRWLGHGVRLLAVVDPDARTVTAYRSLDDVRILQVGDVLHGGDVLSGWELPLADLFG